MVLSAIMLIVVLLIVVAPMLQSMMLCNFAGSAKANGREPKTGLGRVFNYKLGCYNDVHVIMYTDVHPYL